MRPGHIWREPDGSANSSDSDSVRLEPGRDKSAIEVATSTQHYRKRQSRLCPLNDHLGGFYLWIAAHSATRFSPNLWCVPTNSVTWAMEWRAFYGGASWGAEEEMKTDRWKSTII